MLLTRGALAGPDPYSPAAAPPASFYGGYAASAPQSSLVPRSPGLRIFGIVLVVAGGLTLVSAPIVGAASTSPAGDPTASSSTDGAVLGLILGGVGLLAAGIPIAIYASTPVAPPPPAGPNKSVRIEPTATGVRLVF